MGPPGQMSPRLKCVAEGEIVCETFSTPRAEEITARLTETVITHPEVCSG